MFSCNASEMYFKRKVSHKYKMVKDRASGSFSCMGKCLSFTAYFMRGHITPQEDAMINLWSCSQSSARNPGILGPPENCALPKCFLVPKSRWAPRAPSYPCLLSILSLRSNIECIRRNLAPWVYLVPWEINKTKWQSERLQYLVYISFS